MPESGSGAFFVVNLLMLQLRVFLGRKCRIYALFWSDFDADFYADIEDFVQKLCRFLHEKMLVGTSEPCLTSGLTLDLTSRFHDAFPQDCL